MSPEGRAPAVAVVGLGRVGSALAMALDRDGTGPLLVWDRRASVRSEARRTLRRGRVSSSFLEAMAASQLVVCAVPDGVLAALAPPRGAATRTVAHTSGLRPGAALVRFARAGHRVASWHPLRSFARPFEGGSLRGSVMAVEGDAAARRLLSAASRSIGAVPVAISPESKPLYHAAAALTANHATVLAHVASRWLRRAGLSEAQARRGLGELLGSAAANLASAGARAALTGPIRRGDVDAVGEHLRAISRSDPAALFLYVATARAAIEGPDPAARLPRDVRERLAALLRGVRA